MRKQTPSLPTGTELANALAKRLAKMTPAAIANVERLVKRWQANKPTKPTPSAPRVWGKHF